MKKICPDCQGTGKESCEVHGTHTCSRCGGKGCIGGTYHIPDVGPYRQPPYRIRQPQKLILQDVGKVWA